jgi:hypothetical protein
MALERAAMNTILAAQNEPQQRDRLAAQRQLYAEAKRILAAQMLCSVFVSVALALWAASDPQRPQLRVWAGVWGVGFTLADIFWLTPWQKSLKKTAATIQEMFDCDVLQLPWKHGREPADADVVALAARRYERRIDRDKFLEKLSPWYPTGVGALSLPLARIICQRSNFRWDARLRKRYGNVVLCIVVLLCLGVFAYGMAQNLKMLEWLKSVLLPLCPLVILGVRQVWENHEAVESINRLKRDADKLWNEALEGVHADTLTEKSRDLQDELLEQRGRNPLIFDWIYNRLKRADEEQMNIGADALIEQARRANPE